MNRSIAGKISRRIFFRQLVMFLSLDALILALTFVGLLICGMPTRFQSAEEFISLIKARGQVIIENGFVVWRGFAPATFTFEFTFSILFILLLTFELGTLISHAVHNTRTAFRALEPIGNLADTAQELRSVAADTERAVQTQMAALAGELGTIDADRLDQRIKLNDEHAELRELASAINEMLDRVSAAYRAQIRFVSDASHELRTPISVIHGYANLLDRWGTTDEKTMNEASSAIKNEAESMKGLVEQLLFLARGDSDTITLDLETFDLSEIADESVNEFKMIDPAHTFLLKTEPAVVTADRGLIKQAVRILMDNAVKYTDAGGEIAVSTSPQTASVKIAVSDSGIGIAADVLPQVFERFTRADASRARATGGAGLGLAIANWIVTRHSGSLEALSREGVGTRMTIVLPSISE
jgi:signal transduction histidine kinase